MGTNTNKNAFASKMGAILAAAGSAVGLGNVWRFPTETGLNGGAAFILIYVLFMLLLGVPVMISEFVIGRYSQKSVSESFYSMSGGKNAWRYMGLIPMFSSFLVLSYYAVVAGWTLEYAFQAAVNGFAGKEVTQYAVDFVNFSSNPVQPLIWMGLILAITCVIVALGVQKGIERGSKIMMPVLFVFLVILAVCSLSLPNSSQGLMFLLKPDFSKVTAQTVLSAMGQAFFSLSVGLCCLCTYACYFRKDVNLVKDATSVASIDTLVALCSGFIIFPAVYSIQGLQPDAGPSLVFITLPSVFQQVFGDMPVLAYGFSLMFYLLLVVAALTSSISMLEMGTAYFQEKFHVGRVKCAIGVTCVCLVLGTACSLSFGDWSHVKVFGMGFFDLFDYLVAKFIMPIGGLLATFFVGWVVDEQVLKSELTNGGTVSQPLYRVIRLLVRYLTPICILLIFFSELGFF